MYCAIVYKNCDEVRTLKPMELSIDGTPDAIRAHRDYIGRIFQGSEKCSLIGVAYAEQPHVARDQSHIIAANA